MINPIEIFLRVIFVIGIVVAIVFIQMVGKSLIELLGNDKSNDKEDNE